MLYFAYLLLSIVAGSFLFILWKTILALKKHLCSSRIQLTGRVINMWDHRGWGNSISFFNYEKRQVVGHMYHKPRVGDEIRARMNSGKIGRFCVVDVDYKSDPPDMFFCTVSDIGYLE